MKSKRFRKERTAGPRGFSRWITPHIPKYFMGCCDCGLVHEIHFRVAKGRVVGAPASRFLHVQMRVRRADRYTARERKRMGVVVK